MHTLDAAQIAEIVKAVLRVINNFKTKPDNRRANVVVREYGRILEIALEQAFILGLRDGDTIEVETFGERGTVFKNVKIKISDTCAPLFVIDCADAAAAAIKNGDEAHICMQTR